MAAKPLHLINNRITEVEANVTSQGATDAGKLVALDASGKLDMSLLPTGIGADVAVIEASENLAAGDFVNIYDDSGTAKVRKADASDPGKQAHGFVLSAVSASANATVYFEGANTQLSALTPGTTYALDHNTPGDVVALASATTTPGHILQVVGVAVSATTINVELAKPIVRG